MAPPAMISPNASPKTQITAATTMARTRVARSDRRRQVDADGDDDQHHRQHDRGGQALVGDHGRRPPSRAASQPGSPSLHARDHAVQACGARLPGSSAK